MPDERPDAPAAAAGDAARESRPPSHAPSASTAQAAPVDAAAPSRETRRKRPESDPPQMTLQTPHTLRPAYSGGPPWQAISISGTHTSRMSVSRKKLSKTSAAP